MQVNPLQSGQAPQISLENLKRTPGLNTETTLRSLEGIKEVVLQK